MSGRSLVLGVSRGFPAIQNAFLDGFCITCGIIWVGALNGVGEDRAKRL